MNLNLSLQFDSHGRTAETANDPFIRDLIEQVLFTAPGERVNRPSFGSGLLQLVFEPNSNELATTMQFLVQSSLQQWLGDLIAVNDVLVQANDGTLQVEVNYIILKNQQRQIVKFTR